MSSPGSEAPDLNVVGTEEVEIDVAHVDQVRVKMAYYFPKDNEGQPFIGLALNDGEQVYLSLGETVNIANMLLQTVYRAEALNYAIHTHCALTHNESAKRVKEFRDAFHGLVQRS